MPHCQTLLDALRQKGYRLTPQREMIIQAIAHSDQHMTAEAIFAEIQTRTQAVNLATVYRTLDLLVDQGFATRADLGEGQIVYATTEHGPHIHLVCRGCGQIIDANPELLLPIEGQLQSEHHFSPDLNHLSIFGICEQCK
ncbi:MAG TPA: transcriptional repressor [Chloroflexi bacterium]|nr:transcriptional repressor [Chloroflexota bacterium]